MKTIPLSRGKGRAIVDDADYEYLSRFRWSFRGGDGRLLYAGASVDGKAVYMHRLILSAPRGTQVDHINGDTFDNRRENLRLCSQSQNNANRRVRQPGCSSRFKGVSWLKAKRRWRVSIVIGRKQRLVGLFRDEVEAAKAYDVAAVGLFGEFAAVNFPVIGSGTE